MLEDFRANVLKIAAILDDVTGSQQCHNPSYLTYLVDHTTGYLLVVKYFPNIVTPQKLMGGVATTPPLPSCTIVRV